MLSRILSRTPKAMSIKRDKPAEEMESAGGHFNPTSNPDLLFFGERSAQFAI
jgi:hypothetical protein